MHATRSILLLAALVPIAAPLLAQDAGHFDLDAMRRIVGVGSPQLSPDGRSIAVIVSRPNYKDNRYDTELVLVDVASGAARTLTADRHEVSQPAWSPSGNRLAFVATSGTGDSAVSQVFILPMNGGEARRVTAAPGGVQQYAWSPDEATIAYVTQDEAPKREGEQKHNNAFEVGNNDEYLSETTQPFHIWLAASGGGEPRRLTSGTWTVEFNLPPSSPPSPLSWSPDGRAIAFARIPVPQTGSADSTTAWIVDVESGGLRSLTGATRLEFTPTFSPDGILVSYWQPRGLDWNQSVDIWVAPAVGGTGRNLTQALDRNLFLSAWLPGGKELLVAGNDGATVGLWVQPLAGAARRVALGDLVISGAFGYDVHVGKTGAIAFAASSPGRPSELYYLASVDAAPRRLTSYNDTTAALALGRMEEITWKNDGWNENGILVYPPDFSPEGRYPLVLLIHGGPQSASRASFGALSQYLAAQGWLVFMPNYRGSDNLGNGYQKAITEQWGKGPGRDVMAGVATLRKRSYVDARRMAVTGWSYGGFMSTWLAGNYPGEWRAALAGAPVTDWLSEYNLSDGNVAWNLVGGSPWTGDRQKIYAANSPITYATKIRAPTLIMSKTQDFRVPSGQSYMLYHALKDNGVTTQFIAYPGRGHFPGDPVRSMDVFRRWADWLRQYLDEPGVAAAGR